MNEDLMDPTRTYTEIQIASLPKSQRERRVEILLEHSYELFDKQMEEIRRTHKIAGIGILYSGGNDSTVLAHMFRSRSDFAVHANTTIGVEETRQFVRDTCKDWDLPLKERHAPTTYRELVLDPKGGGFPGPGMHWKMYQRLKLRCLEEVRREVVGSRGRSERIIFIGGRRRAESARRKGIPLTDRIGSMIFVSPIATWTKIDLRTYRLMKRDVPVNEVAERIHMSGECLCGAYAKEGELDEIGSWYPDVKKEIQQLERDVAAAGFKRSTWGHGNGKPTKRTGIMCSDCEAPADEHVEAVQ